MKILVVCQYYYPEPVRITDICEELVKRGNDVTVITGIPNYPMGDIYEGYRKKKNRDEIINGVKVHRCFTIPRKHNVIMRVLNYFSFSIFSSIYSKKLKDKYDVVFVNQLSPVMMANAGIKYKMKNNVKLVLYCLDIWPESLKVGGIKENSLIFKLFHFISKNIYSNCDKILITSKNFRTYLESEFNISSDKIDFLPQYAESLFKKEDCYKVPNNTIDFMFAGNMGVTQSLDTIIAAAEKLKNKTNVFFHFVGDGVEFNRLVELVNKKGLNNVIFHGRKNVEEMPKYYSMADAMLVTLSGNSAVSNTIPGKVQSYMAAGKPIIGAINGETQIVINDAHCGFCGKADDVEELVENIHKFKNYKNKKRLGINSFEYYENNYLKEKFIKKLLEELNKINGDL